MDMGAAGRIAALMALHPKGFDLSLDRISDLLARLGNPQRDIPGAFHIAGTNGKGSTTAFLRSILEADGRTVHVHTSPHLVDWHERYRLGEAGGGRFVSDGKLDDAIRRVADANEGRQITVFEIMSAVAFLLFHENEADYSVIEVGLGGRFDATNVIESPLISVITPIGLDHVAWLGDTLEKIAFEKAGIIKCNRPVICGRQNDEARAVIERVAARNRSPIWVKGQDFDAFEQAGRFIYQDEYGLLDLPLPRLSGHHQLDNAALGIAATRMLALQCGELAEIGTRAYEMAMGNVYWPGRFEHLKPGRLVDSLPEQCVRALDIRIDGGHNPQAGLAIARELAELDERAAMPVVMIAGMINTKDATGYFEAFRGLVSRVWTVPVNDSDAGVDPEDLAAQAKRAGFDASASRSVRDALLEACEWRETHPAAANGLRVLISGSLYLVGEVLKENGTPPI